MTHGKASQNPFSQGHSKSASPIKKRARMLIFDHFFLFFSKFGLSLENLMKWVFRGCHGISKTTKHLWFECLRKEHNADWPNFWIRHQNSQKTKKFRISPKLVKSYKMRHINPSWMLQQESLSYPSNFCPLGFLWDYFPVVWPWCYKLHSWSSSDVPCALIAGYLYCLSLEASPSVHWPFLTNTSCPR